MATPDSLELAIVAAWPPGQWQDVTVLVAVSGGADSVALLRAVHRLKRSGDGRLGVLHFNHRLRGAQADADETFVVKLCQQLGLPCEVGRASSAAQSRCDEATARTLRYEFFRAAAERQGSRYIVTGHTADDQIETVLHRIIRGTGLVGLAGIPRQRMLSEAVTAIRPLLTVSRAEVLAYLRQLGQPYQTDATNLETGYTRNRIRHQLLPLLERDYNREIGPAVLRLAALAREAQEVVAEHVKHVAGQAVLQQAHSRVVLDVDQLLRCRSYVLREVLACIWREQKWPLQDMGYVEWQRLAALVEQDSGAVVLPGNIRACRDDATLTITRHAGN